MIQAIIRLQLARIEKRLLEQHEIPFTYDEDVVQLIASRCTELESGARTVDAILTHTLLPAISREFLTRMVEDNAPERVHVSVADQQFQYSFD